MTRIGDLRTCMPADFWTKLRQAMGRDGLLTYRYLGRISADMHGVGVGTMKIRSDMRNETGAIRPGVFAIAAAETGWTDFNSVPVPISAGLSILDAGRDVKAIAMRPQVLRTGQRFGFSRTLITDRDQQDRLLAYSRGIGIKIGDVPVGGGGDPFPLPDDIEDRDLPALISIFGGWRGSDGQWRLPALEPGLRSTSGSLHLGPIHLAFDAALPDIANGHRVTNWEVMFLSAGTVGPFRVEVSPIGGFEGLRAAQFSLLDDGRAGQLVASGTATFGCDA